MPEQSAWPSICYILCRPNSVYVRDYAETGLNSRSRHCLMFSPSISIKIHTFNPITSIGVSAVWVLFDILESMCGTQYGWCRINVEEASWAWEFLTYKSSIKQNVCQIGVGACHWIIWIQAVHVRSHLNKVRTWHCLFLGLIWSAWFCQQTFRWDSQVFTGPVSHLSRYSPAGLVETLNSKHSWEPRLRAVWLSHVSSPLAVFSCCCCCCCCGTYMPQQVNALSLFLAEKFLLPQNLNSLLIFKISKLEVLLASIVVFRGIRWSWGRKLLWPKRWSGWTWRDQHLSGGLDYCQAQTCKSRCRRMWLHACCLPHGTTSSHRRSLLIEFEWHASSCAHSMSLTQLVTDGGFLQTSFFRWHFLETYLD